MREFSQVLADWQQSEPEISIKEILLDRMVREAIVYYLQQKIADAEHPGGTKLDKIAGVRLALSGLT